MSGLLSPDIQETVIGTAQILEIFKVSGAGKVAGSKVMEGEITTASDVRIIRDGAIIYTGKVGTHLLIDAEGDLRLGDNTGAEYVGIDAPATVSGSYTVTLPAAVAGGADYALTTTDGAGNTQWTATSTFGITTGKAIAMAIVFG